MEGETIVSEDSEDLTATQQGKTDLVFYRAFQKNTRSAVLLLFGNVVAFATFCTFLVNGQSSYNIKLCLLANMLVSGLEAVAYTSVWRQCFTSPSFYYDCAVEKSHISKNQPLESEPNSSSFQLLTSAVVYVGSEDLREDVMDQNKKKVYLKVTRRQIWEKVARDSMLQKTEGLRCVFALLGLVFTIIVFVSEELPWSKKAVFGLFAAQLLVNSAAILCCCLCIACIPLCCLGCLCCSCFLWCCGGGRNLIKPKKIGLAIQSASTQQVLNAGGDCSICFMSIKEGESIYVLPCSQKHVYHSGCLSHWTRIKNTCPICRGEIPMTDQVEN